MIRLDWLASVGCLNEVQLAKLRDAWLWFAVYNSNDIPC